MKAAACHVRHQGNRIDLVSPSFTFQLDTARGLRAVSWRNHLTGRTIALGHGAELDLDLDAAERRLYVRGWRGTISQEGQPSPNADRGFHDGFFRPEFEDAAWESSFSPAHWAKNGARYCWARTHLFLPEDCRGKPLTLVLGGVGLFDYRFMRVFVNGRLAGVRQVTDRWHEPGEFDLRKLRVHLRFGQDNVIALQLAGGIVRTARMDELDPQAARTLPIFFLWPGPFEQYVRVGDDFRRKDFRVTDVRVIGQGTAGRVQVALRGRRAALDARVKYDWQTGAPVLRKQVTITNASQDDFRVLRLHLGRYKTDGHVSDGEQGFPVYAGPSKFVVPPSGGIRDTSEEKSRLKSVLQTSDTDYDFFMSLAHPAGWAMGQRDRVELRQYPGQRLRPGESITSMEAVYGVSEKGAARKAFLDHVRSRMRRVRRGHDRPYAIYEPFGSWPLPKGTFLSDAISEKIILDNLRKVGRAQRETGGKFDFYSIEFWADLTGNLERPDTRRFPRGFSRVWRELRRLGIKPGLWICSSEGRWANGANPVMAPSYGCDPTWYAPPPDPAFMANDPRTVTYICRASEPAKTMYTNAFRHHVRNGVRLLKFDGFYPICYNDAHEHLPGIYSTEAICNGMIEFLQALDAECRDVFLMLYWGYRSPWWLLHADTLFESGLLLEAASPAASPTLYARDGVTQGLDQAQWFCEDVPALGKDSLGVWLSDWGWNSCIGKERWPEAFVMDLCRGSLLAQPWSDHAWLTPVERKQFARLAALLRARPDCFRNPRFILGNPWKNEPYGYECRDGRWAFVAIHNCCWKDSVVDIAAFIAIGKVGGRLRRATPGTAVHGNRSPVGDGLPPCYDVYRWHPRPARIVGEAGRVVLRPFEVVLFEVVPAGEAPAIPYPFPRVRLPQVFREATTEVPVKRRGKPNQLGLTGHVPRNAAGGTLVIAADRGRNGLAYQTRTVGREMKLTGAPGAKAAIGPLTQHPNSWQVWRIPARASREPVEFAYTLKAELPSSVELGVQGWFIPTT